MHACANAMRNQALEINPVDHVIVLDYEWDTMKNAQGLVVWSKKIAIVQVVFIIDGAPKVLMLQVHRMTLLHESRVALFKHSHFSFVAINVGGDMNIR